MPEAQTPPLTLQQLAQQQANNPDNHLLQGFAQGLSARGPAQQAIAQGVSPQVAQTLNQPPPATPAAAPPKSRAAAGPAGPSPEQQYLGTSEELEKANIQELEKQKMSIKERQDIYQQGASDRAAATAERDRIDKGYGLEQAMGERVARDNAAQRETARQAMAQKLRQQHVDPQKWFKDRGTAGGIASALAIGAGAFAAAMPHSGNNQNVALDIINKSVDRDVNAQQEEIDKQWKDLDFQGSEDEKAYAKDQHGLAQTTQRRLTAFDHAQAMIGDLRAKTDDELKAKGLDDMSAALGQRQNELRQQYADQHLKVQQHEQTQAAATANAERKKQEEITEYAKKLNADPNFQPKEGMTREEAALRTSDALHRDNKANAGFGTVSHEGKEKKDEGAEVERSLEVFSKAYGEAAPLATLGTRIGGAIIPGGTREQDQVNAVNAQGSAILKSVESRLPQPEAEKIFEANYALKPGMSDLQKAARIEAFKRHVREAVGVKGKSPGAPGEGPLTPDSPGVKPL